MGCRNRTRWQIEGTECENSFRHYRIADLLSRVAVVLIALYLDTVFAHIGTSETLGFFSGLLHPRFGTRSYPHDGRSGTLGRSARCPGGVDLADHFSTSHGLWWGVGPHWAAATGHRCVHCIVRHRLGSYGFPPFVRGGKVG